MMEVRAATLAVLLLLLLASGNGDDGQLEW
jgi:hypothetical protein